MSAILETLRETLLSSPESWQYRLALVEALVAEGYRDEAKLVLEESQGLPRDQSSQIKAARAHGLINPGTGMEILESIIQASPACGPAHFEKASLSLRCGDSQTAKRHYFTALTFDPSLEDRNFENQVDQLESVPYAIPQEIPLPELEAEPEYLEAADSEPAAIVVELDDEFSTPQPVVRPETNTGSQPTTAGDSETGHFYTPIPVQPLRAALESGSIVVRPLVPPDSVPSPPVLAHGQASAYHNLAYTQRCNFEEELRNVYVHPRAREKPVIYDYQDPDDSLFFPSLTPDDIYVAAPGSNNYDRASFASFLENQRLRDRQLARRRRREKAGAFLSATLFMAALLALFWMIKLSFPTEPPPQITATTTVTVPQKTPKRKITNHRQVKTPVTPPSSASPTPVELMTAANTATVAIPDIPPTDSDQIDLGTSFGSGVGFGNSSGSGVSGTFFGSTISGGSMAVVFDITASMYKSNPLVVAEINRKFRNSQVVAVFGAAFRESGDTKLVPYKENAEVLANVEKNGKNSKTQVDMNKALFSLRHCDSLPAGGWEIQSLGRAIEALLNQSPGKQPRTIFIFSDFQDGVDLRYMDEVRKLVKRRRAKIVFYHPVAFTKDLQHYQEFANDTNGEVKEGLPK